jgi:hypothetical protein
VLHSILLERDGISTFLVIFVFAQIDNDLFGAGVEHVEEFTVLGVQAARREIVDASQTVDQFPILNSNNKFLKIWREKTNKFEINR